MNSVHRRERTVNATVQLPVGQVSRYGSYYSACAKRHRDIGHPLYPEDDFMWLSVWRGLCIGWVGPSSGQSQADLGHLSADLAWMTGKCMAIV